MFTQLSPVKKLSSAKYLRQSITMHSLNGFAMPFMKTLALLHKNTNRRKPSRHVRLFIGYFRLAWESLSRSPALSRWPTRQVLLKQIYFTGTESLGTVSLIAILVGLIVVTQINNLVGRNEVLTMQLLIWIVIREMGPLLTAIVIIGRSSSAFASELSDMQVNGEIKNLRRMAISPLSYLLMPRVLGMILAGMALTFYFQAIAISTCWLVNSFRMDMAINSQTTIFFDALKLNEIVASSLKSIIFGMLIATVSCYHGLRAKFAATEVPQAVSQAVIRSLMAVFVADGFITVLMF